MIYFIYAEDKTLLNHQLDILSVNYTQEKLDFTNQNVSELGNKFIEHNLFNTNYIYISYNLDMFYLSKSVYTKKQKDVIIEKLNNSLYPIVVILGKKLKENNKYLPQITEKYEYIEILNSFENSDQYLNHIIKENEIEISKQSLETLKFNLDGNLSMIKSELIKLSNYDRKITMQTIELLSYKTVKSNVFLLIKHILNSDYNKSRTLFNNLVNEGSDPFQIIGALSSQISFIYSVNILKDSMNNRQISQKLNTSEYRVKKTLQDFNSTKTTIIKKKYIKLAEIDYKIKTGNLNPMFIIEYLL